MKIIAVLAPWSRLPVRSPSEQGCGEQRQDIAPSCLGSHFSDTAKSA
jgi:hypothetical protein